MELSHQQIIQAIQSTRAALVSALVGDVPTAARLLAAAVIDDFAVLMATAPAEQRGDLLVMVNEKIAGLGIEVRFTASGSAPSAEAFFGAPTA